MKKTFLFLRPFLFGLILLFSSGWAFGQVFITELADPNNNAGVRYIELYNAGASTVDFTEGSGWRIDKYTNASATVSQTLSLTGSISAGGFYIIATGTDDGDFFTVYGVTADQFDGADNDVAGSNGDDNLELYDGTGTLIDQFGVPGEDGSGKNHEFEDGRAERIASVTTGNSTWDSTEWNIWNDTGGGGTTNDPQDAPADFDPGSWIGEPSSGPTITLSTSTLTGFTYLEGNGPSAEQSFTVQGSDLTADISIAAPTDYEISTGTGGSFSATNPITLSQSGGSVASTTIYTRLKAGLTEASYNGEVITASSTDATDKTVICDGSVTNPSLTITGPNGGEVVYAGQTYDITWTSSSYTGTVDLEYYDGSTYTSIADGETDDGTYSFTVPSDITPGTTYKIRISDDRTNITTSDESDADFEVKASVFVYADFNNTSSTFDSYVMTKQEDLGTASWKYTYLESSNTGITFLFRPTTANWDNKWSRGDIVSANTLTTWYANGADGTFTATTGKYYTYIFKDVAVGSNGEGYVFETTAAPVSLDAVSQSPEYAYSTTPVVVSITASATPSVEEKIYVRYTTDSWATSSFVLAAFTGTDGTATIPAQAAGTDVEYYVLSTCVADISAESNPDLATLNYNVNSGSNYTYTVLGPNTLIISQYYEGASNDKYIEIYNTGSSAVDLSSYYLARWSGTSTPSGSPTNYSALSGTIAAGATQVYKHSSAASPSYAVTAATASTTACYFNGDDPVALTRTGNDWNDRVDCIYAAGTWGANTSFYRKGSVLTGNTAMSVLDGSGEWIEVSNDDVDNATARETEYLSAHFLSTTFTGAVDSDYSNPLNWSNGLPDGDLDVIVEAGLTNFPEIAPGSIYSVNSLEIQAGAEFTINPTATLNTRNLIVVQSDASSSGSLINYGTVSLGSKKRTAINPDVLTYNRWVDDTEWHLLSAPVSGQSVNDVLTNADNSILFSDPDYSMKNYDETNDNWNSLYNTTTAPLVGNMGSGDGYVIKRSGAGTISMSGTLVSSSSTAITRDGQGWNLLGNPFPSAISANTTADATNNLLTVNAASLDPSFTALYVWDYASSTYKIINHASATPAGTLSQDYIQAGQGFFVRSKTGGATFNITAAMQSHQPSVAFKSEAQQWPMISLMAKSATKEASTQIAFNTLMTKGLDVGYDAGMFTANSDFAVYSQLLEDNGVKFGLQALPEDYENLIIPIGLDAKAGDIVTFTAQTLNIPEDFAVVLEDRAMNVFTDLSNDAEYAVQLNNDSEGTGRFFIHTTRQSALGLDDLGKDSFQVFTRVNAHQLVLKGNLSGTARIYSITGKQVAKVNLEQKLENQIPFNQEAGVYIIRISNDKGSYTQKFSWVK